MSLPKNFWEEFDRRLDEKLDKKFDEKSILDSDEVRYAKLKQVVEKLYAFQLGICCFIPCASRDDLGAIDLVNNEKSENSN